MRSERQRPNVYFGRPGALVTLPWPRGDVDQPYDRLTYDFVTGAGQHQVSSLVSGSRSLVLAWNALHVDNYSLLAQYWTGMMGTGPWVYINPASPNLLRGNQASATQQYNDAREWQTFNGTLSSNADPAFVHRVGSRRSLRWLWNVAALNPSILELVAPYRSWYGIPVFAGLPYALSMWVRPDNVVDSSITLSVRLRWMNAAGAQVSEDTSGDAAVTGWVRRSVIATAPGGAAYVQPRVVVVGTTVTTGASLYVDEPLLEQDSVVNDWAPGTGVRPVEITSLPDTVPFATRARIKATMVLRELSA